MKNSLRIGKFNFEGVLVDDISLEFETCADEMKVQLEVLLALPKILKESILAVTEAFEAAAPPVEQPVEGD